MRAVHRWIARPALAALFTLAGTLGGCSRLDREIRGSGTIEMDEVDVASLVGGRVSRLSVNEGDSVRACRIGKGNCTDFHAFFMALAHAAGLPARFRMGYSLPAADKGTLGGGYHVWAEFHAGPVGWVPVDISEAWKHPEKRDFYFGNLDPDRVLVSTGRELELSPRQKGRPLNFLSRPYAEFDGEPRPGLPFERSYAAAGPGG